MIPNFLVAPARIDTLVGPALNTVLLDLTELIVSVVAPVFVTVSESVFELPTATTPSESLRALIENAPPAAASGEA